MFGPEYHKIHTVFKRDERGLILLDEFSRPEFEYLVDCPWRWTEKVDGTNIRIHWDPLADRVRIGGRTDNAQVPTFLIAAIDHLKDPIPFEQAFPDCVGEDTPVTLYGEGYGAKIQKGGGNYRPDQGFILFDVRVGRWWLKHEDVLEVAVNLGLRGIKTVPVLGTWSLREAINRVKTAAFVLNDPLAQDAGDMVSSRWHDVKIEGIVGVPTVDMFDRGGNRVIAKLKLKDFEDLRRRG